MLAFRRHHRARIVRKRRHYATAHEGIDSTACPCSCWMCGNPRKHSNERTIQERKADRDAADQIAEAATQ